MADRTPNWNQGTVDRAIARAEAAFARYEAKMDFDKPEAGNELYRRYQRAVERAKRGSRIVGWRWADVERLP